jgi:site-specific recombinase XerD
MLLILMCDTIDRVSEIIDLKVGNIRLSSPAVVALHGKGAKVRHVPITEKTKSHLKANLEEQKSSYQSKNIKLQKRLYPSQQMTRRTFLLTQ